MTADATTIASAAGAAAPPKPAGGVKKRTGKRKKKPPMLAYINEACTGCAGSPVCQSYCPVEECMVLVQNPGAPTFGVIEVPGPGALYYRLERSMLRVPA